MTTKPKTTGKAAPLPAVQKTAPSPATAKDIENLMAGDANKGFENVTATDMAIPFITILQALSPQVKRGDQQIEDANEGDIFNTVTGTLYAGDEGIFFIPATFKKAVVEWKPRDEGGGFVAQYDDLSEAPNAQKDANGRLVTPEGNVLVDTAYHYGLLVDPVTGEYSPVVISMTSTQLKKSRKWNTLMSNLKLTKADGTKFTPPMFGYMYKLTTIPEENASGSWSGWEIELYGQTHSIDLYHAAKLFAENINKGLVKVAPQQSVTDEPVY
jgi:hypothetical protein